MKYRVVKISSQEVIIVDMDTPLSEKVLLTIEEGAEYFGIGQSKLRQLTDGKSNNLVLWNGNKRLIKRQMMENYLTEAYSI